MTNTANDTDAGYSYITPPSPHGDTMMSLVLIDIASPRLVGYGRPWVPVPAIIGEVRGAFMVRFPDGATQMVFARGFTPMTEDDGTQGYRVQLVAADEVIARQENRPNPGLSDDGASFGDDPADA